MGVAVIVTATDLEAPGALAAGNALCDALRRPASRVRGKE